MAAVLTGCLTADGVLQPDGTGTLTLSYTVPPGFTEASLRPQFEAPGVSIESLTLAASTVTVQLKVTDLAGIGKTRFLRDTTVTKATQGDKEALTIAVRVPPVKRKPDDASLAGPKIRLTLPGKVLEANERGVVEGKTVQWSFSRVDWLAKSNWELVVRYETPPPTEKPAANAG